MHKQNIVIGLLLVLISMVLSASFTLAVEEAPHRLAYLAGDEVVVVELPSMTETRIATTPHQPRNHERIISLDADWEAESIYFFVYEDQLFAAPAHQKEIVQVMIEFIPIDGNLLIFSPGYEKLLFQKLTPTTFDIHEMEAHIEAIPQGGTSKGAPSHRIGQFEGRILPVWPFEDQLLGLARTSDMGRVLSRYDIQTGTAQPLISDIPYFRTPYGGEPDLSPDQTKILYPTRQDGNVRLAIMELTTGQAYIVTEDAYGYAPHWSPDGKKIAFLSDHDNPGTMDVYVIDADGQNLVRISEASTPGMTSFIWLE